MRDYDEWRMYQEEMRREFYQEILDEACIAIIGAGALGCEIAKDFALMGIKKIIIIGMIPDFINELGG